MKKIGWALTLFILIALIALSITFYNCKRQSDALIFEGVDMQQVEDGTYKGACELVLVKVEVSIRVQHHNIMDIVLLKHENGMGSDAERTLQEMKNRNTTDVDAISGATISSNAIRKAAENALLNK